ncbi:hypothetical protein PZ938_02935 [Luteipulveratus sp. YIM 133132]|uniref:hypothetical protein n=1 Tax=Luteipulveratus flavus TaxID=3031728 RepID=UPI0023AF2F6D|nr:hypothetical protein [Luteipulveratus sp. YIM 133132]MDE9364547.1 hypothetical protein [Luteipulveratus sp. YIM 133132]
MSSGTQEQAQAGQAYIAAEYGDPAAQWSAPTDHVALAAKLVAQAEAALADCLRGDDPQAWSRFDGLCRLGELHARIAGLQSQMTVRAHNPFRPAPTKRTSRGLRLRPGGDVDDDGFPEFYEEDRS